MKAPKNNALAVGVFLKLLNGPMRNPEVAVTADNARFMWNHKSSDRIKVAIPKK